MELKFWKYEGVGNDFILLDGRDNNPELPGDTVRALCDRHTGIGADGLMILTLEAGYDFRMKYHDPDGSEVNMCGNGGRCVALFAHHLGLGGTTKKFIGRDGEHLARIVSDEGEMAIIELGMADVDGYEYSDKAFFLNTGVPHYVEFVKGVDEIDVVARGREIRLSERFRAKGGTNVDFVEIVKLGQVKVRTYERGIEEETLACGTGAVAAAIATRLYAQDGCNEFTVSVRGGRLEVEFASADNQHFTGVRLTGPTRRVFRGEIITGNLLAKYF